MKNRKSIGKAMTVLIVMLVTIVSLSGTALLVGTAAGFTQCSDNYDNNQNGLIDSQDPACHTDWNANNPNSYDPTINAEQGGGVVSNTNTNSGWTNTNNTCVSCGTPTTPPPTNNLSVRCEVSDTRIEAGDRVDFEVKISGGRAPYDIDWDGDISGNDDEESVRFNRTGEYDVEVEVTDANGNRDSDRCSTVRVGEGNDNPSTGNRAPQIISSPVTLVQAGTSYSYDVNAFDADGDVVVFALVQAPAGMTINPSTGFISWTAAGGLANTSHAVTVQAFDGKAFTTQSFSVYVQGRQIIYVPGPTVVVEPAVADLDIFDLRVENDANLNVIVSFQTTIPAQGSVYYSLSSHVDDEEQGLSAYEFVRSAGGTTTYHQVNLGRLPMNTTYYLKAHAVAGKQTDTTGELAFVQLPEGIITNGVLGTNTTVIETGVRNDVAFASAFSALGYLIFSPWFLILIIIALLVYLLLSGRKTTHVSTHGPVEIRS
ncbi:MAG: Ig domain-containing protein [Candidatus Paceibacterota bacterium]